MPAMTRLFENSTTTFGSSSVNAYSHAWNVNGSGMNVSRRESGCVLNDVITDHANGMNISSA